MGRTLGSVGLTRIEFEQDFRRKCEELGFSPGEACAQLMAEAADGGDVKAFIGLGIMADRTIGQRDDVGSQQPLLVVDRTTQDRPVHAIEHRDLEHDDGDGAAA